MADVSYLAHHGVKGMQWGVWNDETRRKYLGSHRKTLPKGTKLRRLTNAEEASNPDLTRSMYATKDNKSFKTYLKMDLPATRNEKIASVLNMKLSKDAVYADAETSITLALEKSLGEPLSKFQKGTLKKAVRKDDAGKDLLDDANHFINKYKEKYGDEKISQVLKTRLDDLDPEKVKAAEAVVWFAVTGTVGSYANRKNQESYRARMRRYGFDIIVDPEDETDNFNKNTRMINDPLIILNPSKVIDPDIKVTQKKLR